MFGIFEHEFMLRAFAAGIVTAVIAPTIGIFLVTRRYSFLADTLAHVSLAGVAVGYLTGIHPVLTALIASVAAALCADWLRSSKKLFGESALALFLSGGLALAAVLLSAAQGANVNIGSVLFGSITTVTFNDVLLIAAVGAIIVLITGLFWKQFFLASFDEELATSSGLPVPLLNRLLVILAAVTVALSLRIVGVLLVGALMVIPVIAAMQLQRGFLHTYIYALVFSVLSVIGGLIVSYEFGLSSGGTIVLIAIGFFVLSAIVAKRIR